MNKTINITSFFFIIMLFNLNIGAAKPMINGTQFKAEFKIVKGDELPSVVSSIPIGKKSQVYIFGFVENLTEDGLLLTLDIFSDNNTRVSLSNVKFGWIPGKTRAYFLQYIGMPALQDETLRFLKYRLKEAMLK